MRENKKKRVGLPMVIEPDPTGTVSTRSGRASPSSREVLATASLLLGVKGRVWIHRIRPVAPGNAT